MPTMRSSPGLEDIWQLHWSYGAGIEQNSAGVFIAQLEDAATTARPRSTAPPRGGGGGAAVARLAAGPTGADIEVARSTPRTRLRTGSRSPRSRTARSRCRTAGMHFSKTYAARPRARWVSCPRSMKVQTHESDTASSPRSRRNRRRRARRRDRRARHRQGARKHLAARQEADGEVHRAVARGGDEDLLHAAGISRRARRLGADDRIADPDGLRCRTAGCGCSRC